MRVVCRVYSAIMNGMKHISWFIVCAVLFGAVAGYQLLHFGDFDTTVLTPPPSGKVIIASVPLDVYIADTPEEHKRGLSGRDALGQSEGMLFVFTKDDTHAFWMKDMKFPIDILWLDASGAVVYIEKNISPDSYPRSFVPAEPARFVVEVNAGFVERHSIQVGNVLYSN